MRPVPAALLKPRLEVRCLPEKQEYEVHEIEEAVSCERTEKDAVRAQLSALQTAVRSREAAGKRAIAASTK